jgi:hypothetical protein
LAIFVFFCIAISAFNEENAKLVARERCMQTKNDVSDRFNDPDFKLMGISASKSQYLASFAEIFQNRLPEADASYT